ncbi:hypothetical protein H310_02627 [Aphanomyces invadans]|uniref:Reverse transcriptase RNase H-like domain-containing protein n=1 Tax=Aphanomyces invadans TaxID=157072 RepID=A0A024UKG9_9STRA|nr:hypothetical protein H310_02627 [Aphanomyces invadans]ETW06347.1 hypothetical protein H310_02627 [Aphanomyces invadans]|eukprot:XP_008864422.1 hypothetical protein H310_02627 [Aphanomyces invadans]
MPVRACTEPATKQRIAEWDTGKDPEDVMDDECFAWFMLAYQVDPLALDSLKRQIKAVVVFDMSITDADPRIGMLDGMSSAIRRNCQDWVIREESAAIVKIIVDDIKPTTLHRALCEFAVGHERYVGYEEESKPSVTPDAPKTTQSGKGATRPGGLLSRRQVRNCPAVAKDEAAAFVKSHAKTLAQRRGDTSWKSQDSRVATIRNATATSVSASLLNSGADLKVASGGLVSALLAVGASSEMFEMGSINLQRYGKDSRPIKVTKQVRPRRIEFQTAYGPLLLRGLLWVDETVPAVELSWKYAVWNYSEESRVMPSTVMHRTLRFGHVDDDIDEDEGMCYARPDLSGSADTAQVKSLLASKVDAASRKHFFSHEGVKVPSMTPATVRMCFLSTLVATPCVSRAVQGSCEAGSNAVKSGLRSYPPTHMAFLEQHVRDLEVSGLVCRNTRSRWAAAPRIVPRLVPGWLDDLLGYAATTEDLLLLRRVIEICQAYVLLCAFYTTKTIWCGKEISEVSYTFLTGSREFLCATNWMRANIPMYTELVAPLAKLVDIAAKADDSQKNDSCAVKLTLRRLVPLAHPDPEKMVYLYTDASEKFWGAIAKPVSGEELALPAPELRHEPLAFLSGGFFFHDRWPIVEKEAFEVFESCKRLEYLQIRPGGFRLFTDQRNLVYMFNPLASSTGMAKYQAHNLRRWALTMSTFPVKVMNHLIVRQLETLCSEASLALKEYDPSITDRVAKPDATGC